MVGSQLSVPYWLMRKHRRNHVVVDGEDSVGGVKLDGESLVGGLPMTSPKEPETPMEPMEFLSRSWSVSAQEISKALASNKQVRKPALFDSNVISETADLSQQHPGKEAAKAPATVNGRIRRMHAVLSVAGLAAALAAATAASSTDESKMSIAVASATEILASYCTELAESAGADQERVSSVVRSAIGIRTPSDLLTLTAAAATGIVFCASTCSQSCTRTRKGAQQL